MTVVFVAPPFCGHYRVLYQAAIEWSRAHPGVAVHFVFCGWSNVPLPIRFEDDDDDACALPYTYLHASNVTSSDPNIFNAERAQVLEPLLHQWLLEREREVPIQALVYDFFCWEAARVGARLRLPTYCSIPAVPPIVCPEDVASYRRVCRELVVRVPNLRLDEGARMCLVSDGLYLPGSAGQWLWTPRALFSRKESLAHLGPGSAFVRLDEPSVRESTPAAAASRQHMYVCFGTVVTGNLYRQYPEAMHAWLVCLYGALLEWAKKQGASVTLAIPYEHERIRAALDVVCPTHGAIIVGMCDQQAELARATLFVTHGGGNSVREALDARCGLLVVPFFGDQWDTARRAVYAGRGLMCDALARDTAPFQPASTTWFATVPSPERRTLAASALTEALGLASVLASAMMWHEFDGTTQTVSSRPLDQTSLVWQEGALRTQCRSSRTGDTPDRTKHVGLLFRRRHATLFAAGERQRIKTCPLATPD
jgi:hypothetical protein